MRSEAEGLQPGRPSLAHAETLRVPSRSKCVLLAITIVVAASGCGGKPATTGWATITDVTGDGAVRLRYSSGKANWKRIELDKVRRDVRIAQENAGQPGKYVETKNGGTITFPTGETMTFHDIK